MNKSPAECLRGGNGTACFPRLHTHGQSHFFPPFLNSQKMLCPAHSLVKTPLLPFPALLTIYVAFILWDLTARCGGGALCRQDLESIFLPFSRPFESRRRRVGGEGGGGESRGGPHSDVLMWTTFLDGAEVKACRGGLRVG